MPIDSQDFTRYRYVVSLPSDQGRTERVRTVQWSVRQTQPRKRVTKDDHDDVDDIWSVVNVAKSILLNDVNQKDPATVEEILGVPRRGAV